MLADERWAKVPIRLRATVELEESVVIEVGVRAFREDGTSETDQFSLTIPETVTLTMANGAALEYWLIAEGWWSPIYTIVGKTDSPVVELLLYPASVLEGELRTPEKDRPAEVHLHFEQARDTEADIPIPKGKAACPVEGTRFRCAVPVGTLDLQIRATGFKTLSLPRLLLSKDHPRDLGAINLEAEDRAAAQAGSLELTNHAST